MSMLPMISSPDAPGKQLLLRTLLDSAMQSFGDQEIVYRDQRRHRYHDMRAHIGQLASALSRRGVAAGDTVAFMDWDSHRYLEALFAVPMMGAVLQTVNVRLPIDQLRYCLEDTGARFLCYHGDFAEPVAELAALLPDLVLIPLSGPSTRGTVEDSEYDAPITEMRALGQVKRKRG